MVSDNKFYFLLGWCTAMLFATVFVGCTTPLGAGSSELGSSRWNPLYVVIVDE